MLHEGKTARYSFQKPHFKTYNGIFMQFQEMPGDTVIIPSLFDEATMLTEPTTYCPRSSPHWEQATRVLEAIDNKLCWTFVQSLNLIIGHIVGKVLQPRDDKLTGEIFLFVALIHSNYDAKQTTASVREVVRLFRLLGVIFPFIPAALRYTTLGFRGSRGPCWGSSNRMGAFLQRIFIFLFFYADNEIV